MGTRRALESTVWNQNEVAFCSYSVCAALHFWILSFTASSSKPSSTSFEKV